MLSINSALAIPLLNAEFPACKSSAIMQHYMTALMLARPRLCHRFMSVSTRYVKGSGVSSQAVQLTVR